MHPDPEISENFSFLSIPFSLQDIAYIFLVYKAVLFYEILKANKNKIISNDFPHINGESHI